MSALILDDQTTYVEDAVFLRCRLCRYAVRTPNDSDGQRCDRCQSYEQEQPLSAILLPETMDFTSQKFQFRIVR